MADSENAGRPLVGDVIAGKYRIDNVAGEGGMGIVYEAEHIILRQRVAVKALLPGSVSSVESIERFSLEASSIARITSEHVVRIMDAGSLPNGAPYLVMEYLEGCDLTTLLERRGPLPAVEVVDIALQALDALAHAHAAQIIHRDLKPANLYLAKLPNEREVIKLLDFGVAKTFDASVDDARIYGSPAYMSPEQIRNELLDPRSDIWSLGVVLYELLTGTLPFDGTFNELVLAIVRDDPTPIHERAAGIPLDLSRVIMRCLARDPKERWSSGLELARAIAPFGSGAWASALESIERVASRPPELRPARRFESLELALSALEEEWQRERVASTLPPEAASRRLAAAYQMRRRLRVLLIEADLRGRRAHDAILVKAGFDVRATTPTGELEAFLQDWKPHLVLLFVVAADGVDLLCQRIRERTRAVLPLVLVGETAELPEIANAVRADAFFVETNDRADFVAFVRNICALTYSPEDLPDEA